MNNFYITTTLAYVNSDPHLGFAKELINADIIARYKRQEAFNVFFNTGTDEHGQKIYEKSLEAKMKTIDYCDKYSQKFLELKEKLNLSFNNFIRTTEDNHIEAVKKFWKICNDNGYIYKKKYQVKYCVGCEMEKTDSELDKGICPLHPNQKIELIDEENYFFKFSDFQESLLDFYKKNPDFVRPKSRLNEISNFVNSGLKDFSISRLKEKMPWGISVPGDDKQVIYVWFDALINYISCLGWPNESFNNFWPGLQVCGKDNLRPQSAMWQAMLMSVGIKNSQNILVFGFLTVDGKKISKSLGNNIDPVDTVNKYSIDILRYYLSKEIGTFQDGDFSFEKLEKLYNSDLVNGLGNLVARVSNLIEKSNFDIILREIKFQEEAPLIDEYLKNDQFYLSFKEKMDDYNLSEALNIISLKIKEMDEFLSLKAPWKMEEGKEKESVLRVSAENILNIAILIYPFIPESAFKIIKQFSNIKILKGDILFPRISNN